MITDAEMDKHVGCITSSGPLSGKWVGAPPGWPQQLFDTEEEARDYVRHAMEKGAGKDGGTDHEGPRQAAGEGLCGGGSQVPGK